MNTPGQTEDASEALTLVLAGDPILRRPGKVDDGSSPTPETGRLARAMRELMVMSHGVGIAANQVGSGTRLFVVGDPTPPTTGAEPGVVKSKMRDPFDTYALYDPSWRPLNADTAVWFEGCLSVPGYMAAVERAIHIEVSGADTATGEGVTFEAHGWHARIVQHETDHLDGILYLDRALMRSLSTKEAYLELYSGLGEQQLRHQFT